VEAVVEIEEGLEFGVASLETQGGRVALDGFLKPVDVEPAI
jgi:hypothetical protein